MCGPDGPTHSHGSPLREARRPRRLQERRDEGGLELVVAVGGGARLAAGARRLADHEAMQLAVQRPRNEVAQRKAAQVVRRRRAEQPEVVEGADAVAHVPAERLLPPQPVAAAVTRVEVQRQQLAQPVVAARRCRRCVRSQMVVMSASPPLSVEERAPPSRPASPRGRGRSGCRARGRTSCFRLAEAVEPVEQARRVGGEVVFRGDHQLRSSSAPRSRRNRACRPSGRSRTSGGASARRSAAPAG